MPTVRTAAGKGAELTPTEADTDMKRPVTAVTSTPFTLDLTHNRDIIECCTGSGTLNLTAVATLDNAEPGDWFVDIKNTTTASVTVDGNSSELIDGATTLVIPAGQSARIALDDAQTGFITVLKPLSSLRAVLSGAQTHNSGSGSWDNVVFDSETYDHAGANNTGTGLITIPTGRNFFRVNALLEFAANSTGIRGMALSTTTSSANIFEAGPFVNANASTTAMAHINTGWIPISVASSFYVLGYQNSGGNLAYGTTNSRLYVEFK